MKSSVWGGIWVGVLTLLLACSVLAQDRNPCEDPQTQMEINACAAKEYEEADAELNKVYRQVMSRLSDERKIQLKEAQLAWIKFRDVHCKFETDEYSGGSMYPTLYHGCLTSITKSRTDQLKKVLENISEK